MKKTQNPTTNKIFLKDSLKVHKNPDKNNGHSNTKLIRVITSSHKN